MSIRNLIQKIFNTLGFHISRKKTELKNTTGYIQYPEYINESALIIESNIIGKVIIDKHSMIHKTSILSDCLVEIGRNTSINGSGTEIQSILNPVKIGSFCSIARGVAIQENNHNIDTATTYYIKKHIFNEGVHSDSVSKGPIEIGSDVWIGTQSIILSGVKIGHGAIIAANSVVTNDIPPYAVVAGSPARILKYRFSADIVLKLLNTEWWNWDTEKIIRNKDFFIGELTIQHFDKITI